MNDIVRPFKLGQQVTFHYGQQMVVGTFRQYSGYKHDGNGDTIAQVGIIDLGNGKALAVPMDALSPVESSQQ